MAGFVHSQRTVWSDGTTDALDKTVTQTVDAEDKRSVTIANGGPTAVAIAFTLASLRDYFIVSTKNITLFTNASDGTGGNTISLLANEPLAWNALDYNAKKFTFDVTGMWFTNSSGVDAVVEIRLGRHRTVI